MTKIKRKERVVCPVCHSTSTVGEITSINLKNRSNWITCYFCSNCLSEFDDKGVRVLNSEGDYLCRDTSYGSLQGG